jgi:hypothetical protein
LPSPAIEAADRAVRIDRQDALHWRADETIIAVELQQYAFIECRQHAVLDAANRKPDHVTR